MSIWTAKVNNSSRWQFYKDFKSLITPEKYLNMNIKFVIRKSLARFRCCGHKLRIEVGRHNNIPQEERNCIYCLEHHQIRIIENEEHIFFRCPKYNDLR